MIALIDYGMGNLRSVAKALEVAGGEVIVTQDIKVVEDADKIVLPGVGAFGDAMEELSRLNLISAIKDAINKKKLFLGICLGMQLIFTESEEGGKVKGLDIIKGVVKRLPDNVKVPHIGWNQIEYKISKLEGNALSLAKDIIDGSYAYFCHSYYVEPKDKDIILTGSDYGLNFPSMILKDNIFGLQFHPEKSQRIGIKILENFICL